MKVSVFIATSLDGFIARNNGDIDWLNEANTSVPEGEDCGFQEFMGSVDTLIMGRLTYEKVLSFEHWPYGKTKVIVLSRNPISFPRNVPETVCHSSKSPHDLLTHLTNEKIEHVYVDGGTTIQGFIDGGLIDEITITTIPVILGNGIPLFGSTRNDINLSHLSTTAYDFGFVQTTYAVNKTA